MHYYEVWISSQRYHGDKPLTYGSETELNRGTIVSVPLQRQTVVAVVIRRVKKPSFAAKNIVRIIADEPAPAEMIDLITWLRAYYPGPFGQIVSLAFPGILTAKSRQSVELKPSKQKPQLLPPLSTEQTQVIKKVRESNHNSVLLHGDTGSGKTRIYLELTQETLKSGRSVVLLTPEIGLTPQLAHTCRETFPGQTVVIHSELTNAARRDIWLQILNSKQPLVIIGPRSALFTPIKKVGLIVVDEFHETSYKQEQAPHYLATRTGARLAQLHGAKLVLGSATPPINDYFAFTQKGLPILRMKEQAIKHEFGEPKSVVVDLKDKKQFSRSPWLSDMLIESMEQALASGQQSLVFLNRRGTARLVACQNCGWQALCPNCDLPLTYHGDSHIMRCHTCGHSQKAPSSCPECKAGDIVYKSIGTKSVVSEVERLLPNARVARFDSDTHKSNRLEQQYADIKTGSVDVLVGTQMLGKGLDLPKLSVVGVLAADTSLTFPDYTAEERTFQLVTQALGRVNRGHVPGTAIVQTFNPDNYLIKAAVAKDYEAFYQQQIAERQLYKFPPFRFVLKLTCTRATESTAQRNSTQLADKLRASGLPIEVSGPSPAFTQKSHGQYHWQVIVKSVNRQQLVDIINNLPSNWTYDIDPMNLL